MKKLLLLLIISLLTFGQSCKKDKDTTTSQPDKLISGIWNVDSVEVISYANDQAGPRSVETNWPHTLDFTHASIVIQHKLFSIDTAIFQEIDAAHVLSDLDFDGNTDTTDILIKVPNQSINFRWVIDRKTWDTVEYKTVGVVHISK